MDINLLYEGIDSSYSYQSKVLRMIDKRVQFNHCVLINKSVDQTDHYDLDKYTVLDYGMCAHTEYHKYYDINTFDALSERIISKMFPYEGTAIQLLVREFNFDIYSYGECKRLYLQQLRFWNHLLSANAINFVVLQDNPHHMHEYIIYALAKIHEIPMLVLPGCTIENRRFYCNDIEHIGKFMMKDYEGQQREGDLILPEDVENFYQRNILKNRVSASLDSNGVAKKLHAKESRARHFGDINYKKQYKRKLSRIKQGITVGIKQRSFLEFRKRYAKAQESWAYVKRAHGIVKKMPTLENYDAMAELPKEGDKYILFLLQYQPEASTLPAAGVFVEQELALQCLAKSVEGTGIQIYVKEHFVQPCRPMNFYEDISGIKGVKLIKSSADSKELMKNSYATSTCTGTIILESIINNKPVLVFGHNGFEEGPGIHKVRSTGDCKRAMLSIDNNKFSQSDVRKFLKAFADNTVLTYQYINILDKVQYTKEELKVSRENVVDLISKVIVSYNEIFGE